jgi:type IVB pilus formation R64 PilN family outer membrane protein
VEYSGPIQGLLDLLSARSGLSWEYSSKSGITYAAGIVRTYAIHGAPGTFVFKSTITNKSGQDSSGSGGVGGSTIQDSSAEGEQTNTADLKVDVWKDVETVIKSLLTPRSGSVTLNQVAGTITVRDSPYVLGQVERYVDDLNERLSRQIALSIKIWNLEVSDSADVGLDLALFFENPDVRVFAGASPLRFVDSGGELSAAIVDGKLKNSEALLKGLRSLGKATQLTSGSHIAMNGKSTPVQATRRIAYLAKTEQTSTQYSNTSSLVPGVLTTGFSMNVIPNILDGRRVVLHYAVDLTSLDEIESFSSGDSRIQLPKTSQRKFQQQLTLKMGQTIVLAGFEQVTDADDKRGGLLGFGVSRDYTRSLIIVTISTESGAV